MLTVVIPTDFSDSARNAFQYALSLYGSDQKYVLLNTYAEPTSNVTSMVSLKDILHESSIDSLNEEKAEILQNHPKLNLEILSEYGDPGDSILRYARAKEADVIVMGTDGLSGFKKLVLGSVAAEVLEKAHCPVIVVPRDYRYHEPKHVLYTADLQGEDEIAFREAFLYILKENRSKVTLLTVKLPGTEIDEKKAERGYALDQSLGDYDHKFDVLDSKDVGKSIVDYVDVNNVDLLVSTPRKSSWFQRLLKPSVSKELAERLSVPMMAMH